MPYRICKTIEIENGHQLSTHPDNCRFPHGHSRKVDFILEADSLDARSMVCDFKIIKDAVGPLIDRYDHALCMNSADPMFPVLREAYGERIIAFPDTDPTTELLAKTFYDLAAEALRSYSENKEKKYPLPPSVRLVRVRVSETSSSWAEFSPS